MHLSEHTWQVLNTTLLIIQIAGVMTALWAIHETTCRKKDLLAEGKNGGLLLTVKRAVRCEVIFLLIHSLLLMVSVWAVLTVTLPQEEYALKHYVRSFFTRALISGLLMYLSIADYRDRKKLLREERDRQELDDARAAGITEGQANC